MPRRVSVLLAAAALLLVAAPSTAGNASLPTRLLQVHVLYRHGDRTPMHLLPADPYVAKWAPLGFGQLTPRGVLQQLHLGRYLRRRYTQLGLLHLGIDQRRVFIRSTDTQRTIMSAQAQLAGLFPPAEALEGKLLWRPVPIHVVPVSHDQLLKMSSPCPRFSRLWRTFKGGQEYLAMERRQAPLLRQLAAATRVPGRVDLWRAIQLSDFVSVWHNQGLPSPTWLTRRMQQSLLMLADKKMEWMYGSAAAQRLRGGPVLGAMLDNMERMVKAAAQGVPPESAAAPPLFIGFSAHDTTLAATLSALQVFRPAVKPPLASALLVELHATNATGAGAFVRLLYRPRADQPPLPLRVPGCALDCPLRTLRRLAQQRLVLPLNLTAECFDQAQERQYHLSSEEARNSVVVVLVVLLLVQLAVIGACFRQLRHLRSLTRHTADNRHFVD